MICIIIAVTAALAIAVAVIETGILRVKTFFVEAPEGTDVDHVRITLVSDLHSTAFGPKNQRLIDKIIQTKPDFLVVAGDVINGRESETKYSVDFFDAVREAGIETVYVFGNHEQKLTYISDEAFDAYTDELKKHVRIVNNETVEIGGIVLKGLLIPLKMYRDRMSAIKNYFDAEELVGKFKEDGKYHVLVAHDPTFSNLYEKLGAHLMMCGHLHGGLIRIPFACGIITPRHRLFPRRTRGLYDQGSSKLLVTSGIGWHAVPLRFCNDPQICVVEISKGEISV